MLVDTVAVTFGGEFRTRGESFAEPDFGIDGAEAYEAIAARALLSADVRSTGGVRAFFQVSAAEQDGRRPGVRPFDESRPDLAQAFIEVPVGPSATLRLGRQELGLGNALVALRDGVVLKRAFDGARVDVRIGSSTATAFVAQPVLNGPGTFDDRRTPGERFAGLSWQFPGTSADGVWTAFLFDRERRLGRYAQVSGPERRQTLGLRYARATSTWDIMTQAAVQVGEVGGTDVRAYGAVVDVGWRPAGDAGTRFGVIVGLASGDDDQSDDSLHTFDPLYPNLGTFNDAPLSYYANQINIQANVSRPFGPVTLRADATMLARHTVGDALYGPSGRPIAQPRAGGRLSAVVVEGSVRWRVSNQLEIYVSLLRAEPLEAVKRVRGHPATFALLQVTKGF